jgi:hypothetical protein
MGGKITSPGSVLVKGETNHTIKKQQMLQTHFAAGHNFASRQRESKSIYFFIIIIIYNSGIF